MLRHLAVASAAVAVLACASAACATTYSPRMVSTGSALYDTAADSFAAAGATDAVSFVGTGIIVQFGGNATAMTAVLERSATDPAVAPSWSTIDTFTGAPASLTPNSYDETGVGWWRVRLTNLSGGAATVALSGRRG